MEARPDQVPADDSLDLALPAQLELTRSLEYGQAAAYLQAAEKIVSMSTQPGASALLRIEALCEAGNARRVNGEFAGAIDVLDEAIVAAGELPDGPERDRLLALAHLRMAIIYDVTDAIVSGFEHLDCATSHFKALDDEDGLARCDMVRGALYLRLDDYERSEECYLRSLQHYRRTGETDRIGSTLSNLSVILRFAGRHDEAVAAGREAVKAAQSLLLRTTSMGNLAFALGETGQLKEALAMAREAASMLSAVGDPNYIIEYKRALAWILVREGELHEARDLLVESLATAEEKGYFRDVTRGHGLLAEVYRDLGDFPNAYMHLEKYHELMLAQSRKKAASQMEVHKWRLELESARLQAEQERERQRHLTQSLAELNDMHEKLSERAVQLEWNSYRDALTELANRRYFDERLTREAERSLDSGNGVSLLIIDLDEFKSINDRFGHPVGDEVLRTTARLMQAGTRRSDLCARLGGEEFAVLLTTDVQDSDLHHLAEQLRRAFSEHDWNAIAPGLTATISIGTASLSEVDHDPIMLLKLADQRLYAAKRAGRNQVITGKPLKRQVR